MKILSDLISMPLTVFCRTCIKYSLFSYNKFLLKKAETYAIIIYVVLFNEIVYVTVVTNFLLQFDVYINLQESMRRAISPL